MRANILQKARKEYCALDKNEAHNFASKHALCHYKSKSIYTFIPKNACTTLRYTLAVANGCIAGAEDFEWIHLNNWTFTADLRDLLTADYSFVVLRCPYSRMASFFLDKVVKAVAPATQLTKIIPDIGTLEQLTFRRLCSAMRNAETRKFNSHWRNQSDFLVFSEYGSYFQLEDFSAATAEITRRTGMTVLDARRLSHHGLDSYKLDDSGNFCDVPAGEIRNMMATGYAPSHRSLFDDSIRSDLEAAFQDDIRLYQHHFGSSRLMFS